MNRRDFLKTSAAAAAYLSVARSSVAADPGSKPQPIGLQMYTVREQAEKDLPAVLASLHEIGIDELELYWNLYSRPAAELKKLIAEHGLSAPSGHLDYESFDSKLEYARELGLHYVVCPMLPRSMWDSLDGFMRAADQFNHWGEKAQKLGMLFGYHNHNYEFRKFGDTAGYDAIVNGTDPKLVALEMDCYWLAQAGRDPVQMLKSHAGRVRLIHIKDRKPGFPPSQQLDEDAMHFTEVGTGSLDYRTILAAAKAAGVKHYFLEQDFTTIPPLESVAIGYRNVRRLLS
jgi:sugar phosphate isomerase/epimerase